jgi:hypothetical protein
VKFAGYEHCERCGSANWLLDCAVRDITKANLPGVRIVHRSHDCTKGMPQVLVAVGEDNEYTHVLLESILGDCDTIVMTLRRNGALVYDGDQGYGVETHGMKYVSGYWSDRELTREMSRLVSA